MSREPFFRSVDLSSGDSEQAAHQAGRVATRSLLNRKVGAAIRWQPVDDAYFRLAEMLRTSRAAAPIYIAQNVLVEVEALCEGSASPLVYGLLVGERRAVPKAGRECVLIDEAMHAPPCRSVGEASAEISAALHALGTQASRRGKVPIGWYHGGRSAGSSKARELVALHRALFPEAWQVLLAFDPGADARGTFVRVEPGDGRAYSACFYEMLPDGARAREGRLATVVAWDNYDTTDPVIRLEKQRAYPTGVAVSSPKALREGPFAGVLLRLRGKQRETAAQRATPTRQDGTASAPVRHLYPGTPPRAESPRPSHPVAHSRTVAPPARDAPRPAERPTVSFPMLVPSPPAWAGARSRNAFRWGAASLVAGLIVVIAMLTFRFITL